MEVHPPKADCELMDVLVPLDAPPEGRFEFQVLLLLTDHRITEERAMQLLRLTRREVLVLHGAFLRRLVDDLHAGMSRMESAAEMARDMATALRSES
jgi:hypothetical protein